MAILFCGSTADIPVMFLGLRGVLSLYFVFFAGFFVDLLSDLFWYVLGHKIGVHRFEKMRLFHQKPERMKMIGRALDKYGMAMLFCSKFVYYLGIPTQIVAGAHKYPFKKMLIANALGNACLLLVVYSLARIFASEIVAEHYLKNAYVAFFLLLVVIIILSLTISKIFGRFFNR